MIMSRGGATQLLMLRILVAVAVVLLMAEFAMSMAAASRCKMEIVDLLSTR